VEPLVWWQIFLSLRVAVLLVMATGQTVLVLVVGLGVI
jgi:hypothetical protein